MLQACGHWHRFISEVRMLSCNESTVGVSVDELITRAPRGLSAAVRRRHFTHRAAEAVRQPGFCTETLHTKPHAAVSSPRLRWRDSGHVFGVIHLHIFHSTLRAFRFLFSFQVREPVENLLRIPCELLNMSVSCTTSQNHRYHIFLQCFQIASFKGQRLLC